jgi:phosphoribosylformylglycinamidine (FGAM) synthase-like enzyme
VLAMTVDCNARYVHADPEAGTAIAVAEAARNIACSGGKPLAVTNCLNFGNPYNPEVYWQFVGAIKGMGAACRAFDTPVTGGNVSFYNQTVQGDSSIPVFPTPTIGMIGLLDTPEQALGLGFQQKGDLIFLLGNSKEDISCSQYLYSWHGVKLSPAPAFNLEDELLLQEVLALLNGKKLIASAHDVSDGGLFVTLAESGFVNSTGFNVKTDLAIRKDAFLFGESQGRAVVSVRQENEEAFRAELKKYSGLQFSLLGLVTGGEIVIDAESFGMIGDYAEPYQNALHRIMHEPV